MSTEKKIIIEPYPFFRKLTFEIEKCEMGFKISIQDTQGVKLYRAICESIKVSELNLLRSNEVVNCIFEMPEMNGVPVKIKSI